MVDKSKKPRHEIQSPKIFDFTNGGEAFLTVETVKQLPSEESNKIDPYEKIKNNPFREE